MNHVADQANPVPAAAQQAHGKQSGAAPRGRPRDAGPGGADLPRDASRQARRVAAMVLEVLAGGRTPAEAAQALELLVLRYYQLETRALHGHPFRLYGYCLMTNHFHLLLSPDPGHSISRILQS